VEAPGGRADEARGWAGTVEDEEAARAASSDRAKVTLHEAISRAAGWAFQWRPEWAPALERMASAVLECRTARAYRDGICGSYYVRPRHCGNPLEPDCARRRTARLLDRFETVALDTIRDLFLVLTIPNAPLGELAVGLAILQDALAHLRPWLRERGVSGGVTSIEMPYQRLSASWNLHANLLVDAGRWLPRAELREAWRAVTCDATRRAERRKAGLRGRLPRCAHRYDERFRSIDGCRGASWVWVRRVQGDPGTAERRKSWRELVKYVTKGFLARDGTLLPKVPVEAFAEVLMATRHRRLVQGWGTWFGVHDRAEDPDDVERLRWPDVMPDLVGLPRFCPFCGAEAAWERPIDVPRRACRRRGRHLTWKPPPVPGAERVQ
jgi:hypothetical protein